MASGRNPSKLALLPDTTQKQVVCFSYFLTINLRCENLRQDEPRVDENSSFLIPGKLN